MDKAITFIDKNRIWFSFGTVSLIVGASMWLIMSMNNINTSVILLNYNLENFVDKYDDREAYVDYRMNDFESRLRICEKMFP